MPIETGVWKSEKWKDGEESGQNVWLTGKMKPSAPASIEPDSIKCAHPAFFQCWVWIDWLFQLGSLFLLFQLGSLFLVGSNLLAFHFAFHYGRFQSLSARQHVPVQASSAGILAKIGQSKLHVKLTYTRDPEKALANPGLLPNKPKPLQPLPHPKHRAVAPPSRWATPKGFSSPKPHSGAFWGRIHGFLPRFSLVNLGHFGSLLMAGGARRKKTGTRPPCS